MQHESSGLMILSSSSGGWGGDVGYWIAEGFGGLKPIKLVQYMVRGSTSLVRLILASRDYGPSSPRYSVLEYTTLNPSRGWYVQSKYTIRQIFVSL